MKTLKIELPDNAYFDCKAPRWEDVGLVSLNWDLSAVPEANILGKTPCSDFTGAAPANYFIARNKHGRFLINTEGYTYARYAIKIEEAVL